MFLVVKSVLLDFVTQLFGGFLSAARLRVSSEAEQQLCGPGVWEVLKPVLLPCGSLSTQAIWVTGSARTSRVARIPAGGLGRAGGEAEAEIGTV